MPPSAAPEWLRTGWILERSATSAPASCASIAARIPAQPAPTIRTSCWASTTTETTQTGPGPELLGRGQAQREKPKRGPRDANDNRALTADVIGDRPRATRAPRTAR